MKKAILILFLLLVAFVAFEYFTLPDVTPLATEHPDTTAFMEQRRKDLASEGKDPFIDYHWVPYGAVSPNLRRAVLVAEDDAFYQHEGVDVEGLKEALKKDIERKKLAFGGSTITQQLAKNLYLTPSKNPIRKIKELIIAKRLEKELTKKRILELYLNVVEFGEHVYGAEAASRFYFHKPASNLTPKEAALLAGCLPNPRVMVPSNPNKRLKFRQKLILSRMKRWGYVFEKQVLTAKKPAASQSPEVAPLATAPETGTATSTETATDTSTAIDTSTTEETTTATEETTAPSEPDTPQQPASTDTATTGTQ